MAKKKIPGQIRFLPELDCMSLEGVRQHFEDINFLNTIGQRFFQGGCGGYDGGDEEEVFDDGVNNEDYDGGAEEIEMEEIN